ncbi:MAG: hypothetical protein RBS73_17785 [Prolixibacteraceae bacterium]|jgi:FKBP-type peptidyl-prolyl cis-trans isomerase 2|nr:hypothetical protein [Prolixibacteraceae bacterium]
MDIKEIIESGFFRNLMSSYVYYYSSYHYNDQDRLIYALCSSLEEKQIATLHEIKRIKKKIRKLGHEEMSSDFLHRYKNKSSTYEQENNPIYWEDHFYEHFLYENSEVKSLTPYTDAQSILDKMPEHPLPEDVNDEILMALELLNSEHRNIPYLIECEEEIIDQIETDLDNFKENDDWEIDLDFYKGYIEQSDTLKLLFNLCELLVQLFRLRMFEEFLEYEQEEINTSLVEKTNSTTKNSVEPLKISKSTIDFLIGSDSLKSSLLEFLIKTYSGQKGKNIAIMILALEENKLIAYAGKSELYSAIRIDFGNIGSDAGINKFLTINLRMDKDHLKIVSLHSEKIKNHIENSPK